MDSVRSILIRTCMAQIQKELAQLEHWLIHLPDDVPAPPLATAMPSSSSSSSSSIHQDRILSTLESLSKQIELQQVTLHHVVDRLSVLESVKEVHIEPEDPWMGDEPTPFVPEEDEDNTVYLVHKSEHSSPSTPLSMEPMQIVIPSVEPTQAVQEPVEVVQEPVQDVQEPVQAVQEPVPEPIQAVQEPVPEPVQVVQEPAPEPVQEEEQEEEEEEEGVELEEVVYQGKTYYRDPELFIYSVNEEGEVSEEPIGYWKEKTKTIAFYHKK